MLASLSSLSPSSPHNSYFWCVNCLQKRSVFIILQSYVTWFLRGIRSKGSEEKEKERRDEVVSLEEQLPVEMWGEVGKRLVSRLDVVRFRSVCKKLRSSLPSPNRFPLQVPLPPDHSDVPVHNVPFFITEVNIYSVGLIGSETNPQQRVLMEFEELYQGNKFCIRALIPKRAEVDLFGAKPDIYRGPPLSFVAKAYRLHMAVPYFCNSGDRAGLRSQGKWDFISSRCRVSKIVLISSDANGVDHASYAPASHLSVVALMTRSGKLALLRLGGSVQDPPNWDWETGFCTRVICEITTYKGQLCAIDCAGRAFLMDYNSLHMTQVAAPLWINNNNKIKIKPYSIRLFEADDGDLYLVVLFNKIKFYKLGLRLGKWLEVDDTGNHFLFTGKGYNVCIPRDVLTSNSGSWMIKYKGSSSVSLGEDSLMLAHKEGGDENDFDARTTSSYIGFQVRCIPWFIKQQDSAGPSLTASILSQYDNTIVGRTNYVKMLLLEDSYWPIFS